MREKLLQERREKKRRLSEAENEDALIDVSLELARHTAYCKKMRGKQAKQIRRIEFKTFRNHGETGRQR